MRQKSARANLQSVQVIFFFIEKWKLEKKTVSECNP